MVRSLKATPLVLAGLVVLQVLRLAPGVLFAVPAGAPRHGLTPQAPRRMEHSPSARRVMTVAPMAEKMAGEEPPRHWLWLLVLSCFWPVLCFTFLNEAQILNHAMQSYPQAVGVGVNLALAGLFWSFARLGVFGRSARALVQLVGRTLRRCGMAPWREEVLRKAAGPLASVTQASLVFLAFNFLVNAIPPTATLALPRILTFLDVNQTGLVGAAEIAQQAYGFASRLLLAWIALQGAFFVQAAKEPPQSSIEEPTSLLGKFLNGVQRLQGMNHRTGQHSIQYAQSQEALVVQCADKALSMAAWGAVAAVWAHLADLRFGTLLAIGGMGGLAISLAATNIVQNLISGALIFLHRGVVVGDEIQSADGSISGFVDEIRATNTVIYRHDGEPLIVPNSQLVDNSIVNVQRREFWLIEQAFSIAVPDLKMLPEVVAKMQETLEQKVAPLQTSPFPGKHHFFQEPLCFIENFDGSANVKVRAYVDGSMERHAFYKERSEILTALSDCVHSFDGVRFGFEGGDSGPTMVQIVHED